MFFKNHGVENPENFLGKIHYVGSHDASVLKVLYGEIEAGSAKDLIYEKLASEDPSIEREMIILARSSPVPENALVVRHNIDFPCLHCHQRIGKEGLKTPYSDDEGRPIDFKERLRETLLALSETKEGRAVLRKLGADRFIETTDSDYEELYQMITDLGVDLKDYPYEENE
jgi:ABC-type phosphate/phosphonate transport system substrate-binding protein